MACSLGNVWYDCSLIRIGESYWRSLGRNNAHFPLYVPLLLVAVAELAKRVVGLQTGRLQGVDSLLLLEAGAAGHAGGDSVGIGIDSPVSIRVVVGTSQMIGAVAGLVDLVSEPCPAERAVEVALEGRTGFAGLAPHRVPRAVSA